MLIFHLLAVCFYPVDIDPRTRPTPTATAHAAAAMVVMAAAAIWSIGDYRPTILDRFIQIPWFIVYLFIYFLVMIMRFYFNTSLAVLIATPQSLTASFNLLFIIIIPIVSFSRPRQVRNSTGGQNISHRRDYYKKIMMNTDTHHVTLIKKGTCAPFTYFFFLYSFTLIDKPITLCYGSRRSSA